MKIKNKVVFLTFLVTTQAAFASNQCFVFPFYGPGEPAKVDCSSKAQNMKQCKVACIKAAKKNCPEGVEEFSGSVNFNSTTSGFEADNIKGRCGKK